MLITGPFGQVHPPLTRLYPFLPLILGSVSGNGSSPLLVGPCRTPTWSMSLKNSIRQILSWYLSCSHEGVLCLEPVTCACRSWPLGFNKTQSLFLRRVVLFRRLPGPPLPNTSQIPSRYNLLGWLNKCSWYLPAPRTG